MCPRLVDISLPLDDSFAMWTPAGFDRDLQFEMELLKDFDSPTGAGQVVRGVHMRLHAGTHVDAPEHFVKGGKQVHELPLESFYGPAVIADVTHVGPDGAIDVSDLEEAVGDVLQDGDRLLVRTDWNYHYGKPDWAEGSPYIEPAAVDWAISRGISLLGMDFSHAKDAPNPPSQYYTSRTLCQNDILVMAYLKNLDKIENTRVTLINFPLAIVGAESAPTRAIVIDETPVG